MRTTAHLRAEPHSMLQNGPKAHKSDIRTWPCSLPSPYSIVWTMPPSNSHKYVETCLWNILSKVTTPEPVSSSSNASHVDVREIKSNALTPVDRQNGCAGIHLRQLQCVSNALSARSGGHCTLKKVQLRSPQQTDLLGDDPWYSPPQNLSCPANTARRFPQRSQSAKADQASFSPYVESNWVSPQCSNTSLTSSPKALLLLLSVMTSTRSQIHTPPTPMVNGAR